MKKIILITTGGTIAGMGEPGKNTGYTPGILSPEKLPGIPAGTDIEIIPLCSINSDDIKASHWLKLTGIINREAAREDIAGFVITHGTDTLEETALFLHLTVKTRKPVVITGAMRPASALSPDGAENLREAIRTAFSEKAAGLGVLVVFSGLIFSARDAVKESPFSVTAFSGGEAGAIGTVQDDGIIFYHRPARPHTTETEFTTENLETLPKVSVICFHADADPGLLEYALNHSDGVVVAGAGNREYSLEFGETVKKSQIPVVTVSRISGSCMLSPAKAAVLLRLALTVSRDKKETDRIFGTY